MRVLSVVGARSEFVKCAPVSRVIRRDHQEVLVHTGHRFDYGTTPEFFEDLELPLPDHDLGIASRTHAETTGDLLHRLGPLMSEIEPDWVIVYGSSNGTLAAALAAAKESVPVAYVEAGLRSYRRHTPEEINRVVVDHVARLHFCPTRHAVETLQKEGITEGVHFVGDTILDSLKRLYPRAQASVDEARLQDAVGLDTRGTPFAFATIHHAENTEDPTRLAHVIEALSRISEPVVLPLHPRTQASLEERPELVSRIGPNINIIDPLRPCDVLMVVSRAAVVLTDSGGLQREAYLLGVPCVTLRDDTEFVETLSANTIVGTEVDMVVSVVNQAKQIRRRAPLDEKDCQLGDGHAAERIVEILERRWPDPL